MSDNKEATGMSLDALLSASLDDIADLPSFEVPAPGHYKLGVTISIKKINEKDAVEFGYEVLEVMELADSAGIPPIIGTKFSTAYQIGHPIGLGKFKEAAAPIMEALGTTSYAEVLNGQVAGMQVYATVKRRADKDDPEKFYANVVKVTVA